MNGEGEFETCDFPGCTAPANIVRFPTDGPIVARCGRHRSARLPVTSDPIFESALDVLAGAAVDASRAGALPDGPAAAVRARYHDARRRVAALYYGALWRAAAK